MKEKCRREQKTKKVEGIKNELRGTDLQSFQVENEGKIRTWSGVWSGLQCNEKGLNFSSFLTLNPEAKKMVVAFTLQVFVQSFTCVRVEIRV